MTGKCGVADLEKGGNVELMFREKEGVFAAWAGAWEEGQTIRGEH